MTLVVSEASTPWVAVSGTIAEVLAELKRREVDPDQNVKMFYDGTAEAVTAVYYRGLSL